MWHLNESARPNWCIASETLMSFILLKVRQNLICSQKKPTTVRVSRTPSQLCAWNLSWIWIMRLCCVDKQKQRGLLTDAHIEHLSDERPWSWNRPACQQGVWRLTHLAKSSTVPPREVRRECSFVCSAVGCTCSAPGPRTQQPSWRRQQSCRKEENCVCFNFELSGWILWSCYFPSELRR